eukprot:GHUV01034746.1.p1 GENE.GHUV01034746.1~~GHUV01034746.1.p1  ORF type:complete len:121 (-),score=14.28 GHUV01034746.1:319-681(-)
MSYRHPPQRHPPCWLQAGEFVAFLPGDNQDLANPNTHAVIELINQDLSQLLRLLPQQFWQVVLTDKSLHTCLDSFLRFRRWVIALKVSDRSLLVPAAAAAPVRLQLSTGNCMMLCCTLDV